MNFQICSPESSQLAFQVDGIGHTILIVNLMERYFDEKVASPRAQLSICPFVVVYSLISSVIDVRAAVWTSLGHIGRVPEGRLKVLLLIPLGPARLEIESVGGGASLFFVLAGGASGPGLLCERE